MKRAVIVVAAGSGSRMGGELPKQYLQLQGKPVIIHTLEKFRNFDPEIKVVVVLAPAHRELWEDVATSYAICKDLVLAEGGASRYDSVKSGLTHIGEEGLIGIHDAVRPLVSQDTLLRTYEAAQHKGSGIPVIEIEETVRRLDDGGGSTHLNRSILRKIQTPQVFRAGQIKEAYQQAYDSAFTDDASVYESVYGNVNLVEGNRENIKITTSTDMQLASLLIASPE
ncbi:MAG: 2-C-methyl-D-erythritol 4-phosphate cytidylyltransferase [Bacteroidota bacterium]|nr:2-C-methyl-D-erythritol 4-phosphate cytidylyltransferase [Bacteroidota bacterium]